jgi:hypothetical protein
MVAVAVGLQIQADDLDVFFDRFTSLWAGNAAGQLLFHLLHELLVAPVLALKGIQAYVHTQDQMAVAVKGLQRFQFRDRDQRDLRYS